TRCHPADRSSRRTVILPWSSPLRDTMVSVPTPFWGSRRSIAHGWLTLANDHDRSAAGLPEAACQPVAARPARTASQEQAPASESVAFERRTVTTRRLRTR